MSKMQFLNYLAIDTLEQAGVMEPTQSDIDLVESLLLRLSRENKRRIAKSAEVQPTPANIKQIPSNVVSYKQQDYDIALRA